MYVEFHARSAFSFLEGASLPEDLVSTCAQYQMAAMALLDRDGLYGSPRFYLSAKHIGLTAHIGSEVSCEALQKQNRSPQRHRDTEKNKGNNNSALHSLKNCHPERSEGPAFSSYSSPRSISEIKNQSNSLGTRDSVLGTKNSVLETRAFRLPLLVSSRRGYQNLCQLITRMKLRAARKEEGAVLEHELEQHAPGLICLTGGDEGPLAAALQKGGPEEAHRAVDHLVSIFGHDNVYVELQRHLHREEEARNRVAIEIARDLHLPLLATNGVCYATPQQRELCDVFTSIRHHQTLMTAGRLLARNSERHLKSPKEMAWLFADLPEAIANTIELSARLEFKLSDLGYEFPRYPIPEGETMNSFLRQRTDEGACWRYGISLSGDRVPQSGFHNKDLQQRARRQIERELQLIEKLDLAGYFLIVWDIVRFCREQNILAQGRGSAANSAVCYSLGITAVDPVGMELLFERFLSEERGEWPDIDIDLPSGDQRERVIQHIYQLYGQRGAAMTANVITYRNRMAAREMGKAMGFDPETLNKISAAVATWEYKDGNDALDRRFHDAGLDLNHPRLRKYFELCTAVQDLPRHLGQHSGGMVICQGQLDSVVPLEPASMPGRVVVQWDKEDCADMGIIKVDLLGLGMMAVLEDSIQLIRNDYREEVDLAHLPPDDPEVYATLQKADTVGMFQIESRAQMSCLPRLLPKKFYDIVVQVAIIRPGPIVGQMVNPFLLRRQGRETVTYPHPSLEPVLARTMGVPLFQEQLLRIAMISANFTGGEAEELRRAMGFKRSQARMKEIEVRLREGMTRNGFTKEAQEQIILSITSFALYGFPESHAASFALIAYASAWLKCHYLGAFTAALLNNQPMGFYHPATLVKDAQRHGLKILPVDVTRSDWKCTLEPASSHQSSVARQSAISYQPSTVSQEPVVGRRWSVAGEHAVSHQLSAISQNVSGCDFSRAEQAIPSKAALAAEKQAISYEPSAISKLQPDTHDSSSQPGFVSGRAFRRAEQAIPSKAALAAEKQAISYEPSAISKLQPDTHDSSSQPGFVSGRAFRRAAQAIPSNAALAAETKAISHQPSAISKLQPDTHDSSSQPGFVSGRDFSRAEQAIPSKAALAAEKQAISYEPSAISHPTPVIVNRFIAGQGFSPTHQPTWDEIGAYSHSDFVPTAQRQTHPFPSDRESSLKNCHPERSEGPASSPRCALHTANLPSDIDNLKSPNSSVPQCLCDEKKSPTLALRLGLNYVRGLRESAAQALVRERSLAPFQSIHDLTRRVPELRKDELTTLAEIGALNSIGNPPQRHREAERGGEKESIYEKGEAYFPEQSFPEQSSPEQSSSTFKNCHPERSEGPAFSSPPAPLNLQSEITNRKSSSVSLRLCDERSNLSKPETRNSKLNSKPTFHRRDALWQVEKAIRRSGPLLEDFPEPDSPSPLDQMTHEERLVADFRGTGLTVGPHPMAYRRAEMSALGIRSAAELKSLRNGQRLRIGGCVIARQRPGTAKGFLFLSLEDETGIANAIVTPDILQRNRILLISERFLMIEGVLQHQDNVIHVRAERVLPLSVTQAETSSHDFH